MKSSQVDRAIAQLEAERQVLDLAILKLKDQKKEPRLRVAKARIGTEKSPA